jgi:amino acid permease
MVCDSFHRVSLLVFLVAFRSFRDLLDEGIDRSESELTLANFAPDIFRSLPIMSFAFTFHPNIFPVFSEMKCAPSHRPSSGPINKSCFY